MELPRVLLLISVFCVNSALGQYKQCKSTQRCVEFSACTEFNMYDSSKISKWPESVKATVKDRLCNMEYRGSAKIYSVCCNAEKPRTMPSSGTAQLNAPDCGKHSEERVAYGEGAKVFQYPWMALLLDFNKEIVCGGTLISKSYVLTAAHCQKSSRKITYVRLGENDISKRIDCNYFLKGVWEDCADLPQEIEVDRFIRHEKYSPGKKKNDIALIKLASPATLSDSVKTICLPIGPVLQNQPLPPEMIVSGWGYNENGTTSNVLQVAKLQHVEMSRCARSIQERNNALSLDASQFCAQGKKLVDNCSGDSGGPMQYAVPRIGIVQHGVVSYGLATCGLDSSPGVYTRVSHFANWIVKNMI